MNIFLTDINENRRTGLPSLLRVFLRSSIRRWALGVRCSEFASLLLLRPLSSAVRRPSSGRLSSPLRSPSSLDWRLASGVRRPSSGFTLIEVLVAMTVLALLILMVANIFQSSSAAWNIGTQKADMNTAARAALDFMARELACAVAGPIEAANPPALPAISFRLSGGNDVQFVALSGDPQDGRALRGIRFQHNNSVLGSPLMHERFTNNFNPYDGTWSGGSGLQPLITNVLSLTMVAFANEFELGGAGSDYSDPANTNGLPLCLDIAIEMLSDDDMRRYNEPGVDTTEFRARNAKLYSTRVYFPNRVGYGAR